jgi:hypothetical protein
VIVIADAGTVKASVVVEYDGSGLKQAREDLASLGEMAGSFGDSAGGVGESLAGLEDQFAETGRGARDFSTALGDLERPLNKGNAALSEWSDNLYESQGIIADTGSTISEELNRPLAATNEQLPQLAKTTHEAMGSVSEDFEQAGSAVGKVHETFGEFDAGAWADQMHSIGLETWDLSDAVGSVSEGINKFGGIGSMSYGPLDLFTGRGAEGIAGIGEAWSSFSSGLMDFMMPFFMIEGGVMMAQQLGQTIYNAAAIAEGPAAHAMGTFTGTIDAIGQSAQQAAAQFSEGFGQGLLPTLDAINHEISQGGSGSVNDFGVVTGGTVGFLGSLLGLGVGGALISTGLGAGLGAKIAGGSIEGIMNSLGLSDFVGAGPQSAGQTDLTQIRSQMPQAIQKLIAQTQGNAETILALADNPNYLAQQDQLTAAQQYLQRKQQSYDIQHPISQAQLERDSSYDNYVQQQAQQGNPWAQAALGMPVTSGGGFSFGPMIDSGGPKQSVLGSLLGFEPVQGMGNVFGEIGSFFSGLFPQLGAGGAGADFGGCFPAGTSVLMADGSEQPIEQLKRGDCVLGYDGLASVPVTVLARLTPPARQVYELLFADGSTLTLTDSHPISTPQGWKSLNPEHTKRENPDLEVTVLQIGDSVHMVDGLMLLMAVKPRGVEQIYNITVDGPHTFYANRILVHNKALGDQVAQQISGIQLPHMDLSGIASNLAGSFSGIQLPHLDLSGMVSNLGGAFSGLSLPHIDLSGVVSGLSGAFSGLSLPHIDLSGITAGLSGAFSGISLPHLDLSGISASLSGAFSGISIPSLPNIASNISAQLGSMFSGISLPSIPNIAASITGQLSSIFSGIQLPSIPNIGGMLNGELSSLFSGLQMPNPPDIAGMLNSILGGLFKGIQLPTPPNISGMINGMLSGLFSGIQMPSIPFFASGVEGYTGLGIVGESGPELVSLNGGSVYPLTNSGAGGSVSPISLGGSSAPQAVNVIVQIDSQSFISAIGLPLASVVRVGTGGRSF